MGISTFDAGDTFGDSERITRSKETIIIRQLNKILICSLYRYSIIYTSYNKNLPSMRSAISDGEKLHNKSSLLVTSAWKYL